MLPKFQLLSSQILKLKYFIVEVEAEVKLIPAACFLSYLDGRRPEDQGSERRRGGHPRGGHGSLPGHGWERTPLRLGESLLCPEIQSVAAAALKQSGFFPQLPNAGKWKCREQSLVTAWSQTMGEEQELRSLAGLLEELEGS